MKNKEKNIILRRLRSSYLTSMISISLVLFMLGLVGLLVLNARKLSVYVKENIGFSVILKDNVNEAEIIRLQKSLDAARYVRSTEYIPKEKAAKDLAEELGEDFIAFLGYNPLPVSIDVKLVAEYANNDSIAVIEKDLQTFDQVKEVYYQKSLVHLVNENVKRISMIILLFSGLLFLVAIALVNNTIRLSVYSKRFIINTMQLVGATHSFIRKPFLFRSAMHGVYASLLSVALLMLTIYWIQKQLSGVISLRDHDIVGILFVMVLVLGVILNWIATFFAVNKYLHLDKNDLYY